MTINDVENYIKNGQQTYLNKTRLYLAPCMEGYGEEVMQAINNLNYFWCGVDLDIKYHILYLYKEYNPVIYDIINIRSVSQVFDHNYFLVHLKIPKSMHQAYDKFMQSKYSEMYNREQLEKIFINPDARFGNVRVKELALPVLIKHPKRKETFEQLINGWAKNAGDDSYIYLPDEVEFDTLWKKEHEVLFI